MSQMPPSEPQHRPPSARPAHEQPPPPGRPTSFLVFGILNIVLGALGACCTGWGAVGVWIDFTVGNPNAPEMNRKMAEFMAQATTYKAFATVANGLWSLICVGLVIAGIGLIQGRAWARTTSIALAVGFITITVVSTVGTLLLYSIPLLDIIPQDQPMRQWMEVGVWMGPVVSLLWLVYPVVLIVFMMRRSAREATGADTSRPAVSERGSW